MKKTAARKLWRKYKFYLINPFGLVFRYMVQNEPSFMQMLKAGPGECGDDPDSHAGTNETSLVLSLDEKKAGNYTGVPPSLLPESKGLSSFVHGLGGFLKILGFKVLGSDLVHLANTLTWVGDKEMKPYLGDPSIADEKAGQAMLDARVEVAMRIFDQVLQGEKIEIKPLLWQVRFLRWFA